ncbi:MAG: hypothetical protein H0T42_11360 [Deltaproteobacteria bacterium]|nr:hypothetical protein [Deltaproteobacteria bacterium]
MRLHGMPPPRWMLLWLGLAAILVGCATGPHHRVTLGAGGSASSIASWTVLDASPLPDGRVVVAGRYEGHRGEAAQWLPRTAGDGVAAVSARGTLDWVIAAKAGGDQRTFRISVASDGATWILARNYGEFVDARTTKPRGEQERTALTRVSRDGQIERTITMSALKIVEDTLPYFVAATPDGGAIAVLGSSHGVVVVRVGHDGGARYVRRLDRGAERAPSDGGIAVRGVLHGKALYLAGAGTALYVTTEPRPQIDAKWIAPDGTYHGPTVLQIDVDSGAPRVFPLERTWNPAGSGYPAGIAVVGNRVILARNGSHASRVTLHDPTTLTEERSLYTVEHAQIQGMTADGDAHVLVVTRQRGQVTVRYGTIAGETRTVPPTSAALVAQRFDVATGAASVVTVATSASADPDTDVGGSIEPVATAVGVVGAVVIIGTFSGLLHIDHRGPLRGTYGTEDRCNQEGYDHREGCDRVFWDAPTAFVIRRPR